MDKKCDLCLWNQGSGGGGGGGSSTLSGLTDVDISNPTDGQTLVYNSTSGKWENVAGGGSGGGVLVVHDIDGTLDKTWQEIHDAAITRGVIVVAEVEESGMTYDYTWWVAQCITGTDPLVGQIWDVIDSSDIYHARASSANGYPIHF